MSTANKNPGPLARKVQAKPATPAGTTPTTPARPEPAQPKPVATKPAKATEPAKVKPPKPEPVAVAQSPPIPPERKCYPLWAEHNKQGQRIWEQPGRDELTETCQNVSEIPTEPNPDLVFQGRLLRYFVGWTNRPMLVLEVPPSFERCEGKKHRFETRYFPWRFDWPVSPETVSRQSTALKKYPGRNVWLVLDPDKMAEHEEVWKTAKAELDEWSKAREAKKAAVVDPGGAGS